MVGVLISVRICDTVIVSVLCSGAVCFFHVSIPYAAGVAIMDDDRLMTELNDFVFGFRVWQVNVLITIKDMTSLGMT